MIYFIITLFLFASMEVVSKPIMMSGFDPFFLTFIRFGLGLITLFGYSVYTNQITQIGKIKLKQLSLLCFLGFINVFFSMSFLQVAVKQTNAATAALIICSNPLFVLIMSILLKYEIFSLKRIMAFTIGIIGIIIASLSKELIVDKGAVYALISSVSFALYVVLSKKALKEISVLTTNIVSFSFGLIVLFLYLFIFSKSSMSIQLFHDITLRYFIELLYLGIGVSGLGYITFMKTLQLLSASSASVVFFFKPVVSTILSVVFLNELLQSNFFVGLVLVSIASFLILKPLNISTLKK